MSFPVVCVSNVYTQMLVCICLYNVYYNNMMIAAFWSGCTVFVVFLFFLIWRNIDRHVNQICLCPPVCLSQMHGDVSRPIWLQAAESAYRFTLGSLAGGEILHTHTIQLIYCFLVKKIFCILHMLMSDE